MRLRTQLGVVLAVVTVPAAAAMLYFDAASRHRAAQERLVGVVDAQLEQGSASRCLADPAAFARRPRGGPPPPAEREPFDHSPHVGRPERPPPRPEGLDEMAPSRPATVTMLDEHGRAAEGTRAPLSETILANARASEAVLLPWRLGSDEVSVLVATGWGGACSFAWAHGTTSPSWGALLPRTSWWLVPLALLYATVLLATGPLVRRVRKLTREVDRARARGYRGPLQIEGSDEVADLARSFDAAARTIESELRERERSERALRDFLANTTHDVMIPLTVLQGHLASLREALPTAPPPVADTLRGAMDEAHYVGSLLHNLAIASKVDAETPALHEADVDLNTLVERVVARHRTIADARGVALEMAVAADAIHTQGDVTVLEQAVSNVVYNAVRYNRAGGNVAVVLDRDERRFTLRVLDDGPGIPSDRRAVVLQRGAREDHARTRAPEGQGLGLYIARRAAELHGFTLSLDASEAGGLLVELSGLRLNH